MLTRRDGDEFDYTRLKMHGENKAFLLHHGRPAMAQAPRFIKNTLSKYFPPDVLYGSFVSHLLANTHLPASVSSIMQVLSFSPNKTSHRVFYI
jgi:hypothetical protein